MTFPGHMILLTRTLSTRMAPAENWTNLTQKGRVEMNQRMTAQATSRGKSIFASKTRKPFPSLVKNTRQSVQRPLPPSNIPRSSTSTTRAVPPPGKPTDPDELRTCNALTSAEHQVASHKSQMNSLHMQLSTRTSELHQHASKAEMLEKKLQETKVLLEARTVELCAAQAFVTTADSMSVAEVTRFVEKLNDEVYQVAVDLGNTVLKHRLPENCLRRACFWEVVVKVWGDAVVDRLHADIQKEDTLLFEALAQNTVLAFCLAVVRSLCDWNAQVDEEIRLVWDEIRKSTDLAVAKNWLALTKHSSPRSFNRFGCTMDLMELMAFAGVPLDVLMDSAKQTIGAKISLILSKALKIREMVNAGVLSAHVELILQLRL
ncbi:hypothetical protein DFP72DRAFT_555205 [Ephemerocybe angulata]|uniref:Uncharacterized protein n=1 Tax=Ephemerocybe angulata TaxID=980116 RepID=A0A8H6M0C2_9AGAR|nr:hypothetical protein DFP72DRAFT_555205 [Tulosesus angulatus]